MKKITEWLYDLRGDLVLRRIQSWREVGAEPFSPDESVLLRVLNFMSELHDFFLGMWRSWCFAKRFPALNFYEEFYHMRPLQALWEICTELGRNR